MRHRTSWGRRLRWGLGVTSAVLVGVGAPVAGQTAERAPSPAQEQPDPQAGEASESFVGSERHVGRDGLGGDGAAPTGPEDPKDGAFRPAGENSPDSQDVPGQERPATEEPAVATVPLPRRPLPAEVAKVEAALAADGSARVIVMARTTAKLEADLSSSQLDAQHEAVAASLDGVEATLAGTGSTKVQELQTVPSAVYEVTAEGLDALLADPAVASVVLDAEVHSMLDFSTAVIDSDLLNAAGVLGNGFEGGSGRLDVAIIDSGVDSGHNAFTGRIVRQACFVTDSSCPGGTNASTAAGSGEECTHSTDCDHGTHVAGIAAGGVYSGGHEGVARGAGIVAVKVAQDNPGSSRWTAQWSSIDAALQHVLNLKNSTNPNIVAVNMSLGGSLSGGVCDASLPATAALVNNLLAAGVATVIAAGNDGSNSMVSFPGCLSNAITVSATDNADLTAGFTNSNAVTDFWAPGVSITAPIPTTNNEGPKSGTSMAAPHVAGAFTLLRECVLHSTVASVEASLDATGVDVTRNGVTRKRINVLDAATRTVNNNDFANPEALVGNGPFNDFDWNVCADAEPGEPGGQAVQDSIWWTWTPATTGTATISTQDGGGNATTFDTTLQVYTGNSLGSLTSIAFNDDIDVVTDRRSRVVIPVNAGTTYRMQVDGFGGQNGELNLHIENGPPPTCFGVPATIVGTVNNDVINGTPGSDVIVAGDGNDRIDGLGGNDRICAGNGNDILAGRLGNDSYRGEGGTDTASFAGSPASVSVNLIAGTAAGEGADSLFTVENVIGSAFADTLTGSAASNLLDGRNGRDGLRGVGASDILLGGSGNDIALGGAGNDNLVGAAGNDRLFGEAGNDSHNGGAGLDRCNGGLGLDAQVLCEGVINVP